MVYVNPDGLVLKFGTEKATANTAGEYGDALRDRQFIEVKIDLTTLTTTDKVQSYQVFFPKNARIESVQIAGLTAAVTGSSALLNVGLSRTDLSSSGGVGTQVDFDGILAAATTAQMTLGIETTITKGGTSAGALLGSGAAATANPAYITAATTTGTYSAGLVNVRIAYMVA